MSHTQAPIFKVRVDRDDSGTPWGFRIQGGADFSTPLSIQKVTPGSITEGKLEAGDTILQINNVNTDVLEHEQAKMEIIRSGNDIVFTVQRGGVVTWKPSVTPLSELKPEQSAHSLPGEPPLMQKTSLEAGYKKDSLNIGSSHNRAAAPFAPGDTPTYTPAQAQPPPPADQQASVISQISNMQLSSGNGAPEEDTGIDYSSQFTPTGAQHDIASSRTMKMLERSMQGQPVPDPSAPAPVASVTGMRSVHAPRTQPGAGQRPKNNPICQECKGCGRIISDRGMFVTVKDFFFHPECFKCEACGVNLRQKGYFFINNQILCETHARIKTRPPGPGMVAVVTDAPDDYE